MGWRVLVLLAVTACYEAPKGLCGIACETTCPDGLVCTANVCQPADGTTCTTIPPASFRGLGVGGHFACALDDTGAALCWGDNHYGQIGNGSAQSTVAQPTRVGDGATTFMALAVGSEHACGLLDTGEVRCWGDDSQGQVEGGDGGAIRTPTPVTFRSTPPAFTAITAGGTHTCAIGSGQLWCWGDEAIIGTTNGSGIRIGTDADWTAVSAGFDHVCGLRGSAVWCFGGNDHGQVDPATIGVDVATPTEITLAGPAIKVVAGSDTTCAIVGATPGDTMGELYCWGSSDHLRISDTDNGDQPVTQIGTHEDWTSVSTGDQVACGIRAGQGQCWGFGNTGILGNGYWSDTVKIAEADQAPIGPADELVVSPNSPRSPTENHACLRSGTSIACWGQSTSGELGGGSPSRSYDPVQIAAPGGIGWSFVWAGGDHLCATTTDQKLWCWGDDERGQVSAQVPRGGSGSPCLATRPCDAPTPTAAPSGIGAIVDRDHLVVGFQYTCALVGTAIQCWGNDDSGNLGGGGNTQPAVNAVAGSWRALSGGQRATCAIKTTDATNTPQCWGVVAFGGSISSTPRAAGGAAASSTSFAFGEGFGCSVGTTGQPNARACWGSDAAYQYGDGTQNTNNATPTLIATDPHVAVALTASRGHMCMVDTTGGVQCWGDNSSYVTGQLVSPVKTAAIVKDTEMMPLAGCTHVQTSTDHTCAVCGGKAYCWGQNGSGESGRGEMNPGTYFTAYALPLAGTVVEIAVQDSGGCAVTDTGELWCWGDGAHGQLGNGAQDRNLPTKILGSL